MKNRITKYVVGDKIYFQTVEGSILSSEYKELALGDFSLIGSNKTCFCINNKSKEIYRLINDELVSTKFKGYSIYEVDSSLIVVFNVSGDENISTAFREDEIIWETNDKRFSTVFSKSYLAYKPQYRTNKVIIKNIETNNIACQYEFDENFMVARKLHLNGNDLIVSLMKKDLSESRIACLSIVDNEEKWNIKSRSHEHIIHDQKLYALLGSVTNSITELEVIELTQGKQKTRIIQELERDIVPWNCTIKKDKLYFSNNHKGCTIGTINLGKDKIESEYELNLEVGVKLFESRKVNRELIVRDTMNNVHRINESNHT